MRKLTLGSLVAIALLLTVAALPAAANSAVNGQIAFGRLDPLLGDTVPYAINPDGTHEQQMIHQALEAPQYSPDSTLVSGCCTQTEQSHSATTILDPDSHTVVRMLPQPDPGALDAYCGRWSADGARVACETFGVDDSSRNGIYTIRSSDGGGLKRVTSDPDDPYGGDDHPGDFSPDGRRLALTRYSSDCFGCVYVVNANGTGLHRVTPDGLGVVSSEVSWSPKGNTLLFSAHRTSAVHSTLWTVHADGSDLHEIDVAVGPGQFECGAANSDPAAGGCFGPSWSPDGKKIVFVRGDDGKGENIFTVNPDGSGLFQITNGGSDDYNEAPDWGTHPLG
jgi:TolB protein